jgi:hypothetical protein
MEWQSLLFNGHYRVWLDHLSWLVGHLEFGAVKEVHDKVDSGKGFKKSDFLLKEKICTLSLESRMRLLIYNNNDITSVSIGMLICFTVENIFLSMWCTLIDSTF